MKDKYKILLGTITAIFLGAVGSGVWQYILDPVVSTSSRAILNLATLGMDSFKNDLYQEIAKGFHEQASNHLYDLFSTTFVIAMMGLVIALLLKTKELIQRRVELLEDVARLENGEARQRTPLSEIRASLKNTKPNKLLVALYVLLAFNIVMLSAQYVTAKSNRYINEAITYYYQSKKIVAPYIDESELNKLDSEFSLVKSSKDFGILISHIRVIAEKNSIALPNFDLW